MNRHGWSNSASPTPQISVPMGNSKETFKPLFKLSRSWVKLPEYLSQRVTLQICYGNNQKITFQQAFQAPGGKGSQDKGESRDYLSDRRRTEPYVAYSDSFRLRRSKPISFPSGFTSFRNQKISDPESLFFKISGTFQKKASIKGKKYLFKPGAE
ncbi:hypothetical protein O181_026475 [Austropuccinia psidii MF-1]|uniref:Uncharacterized protein n=1 Tax=Austropuccinia psidii MF-1 TaxID=1389203 RepID=A0A9Q3H277_9BASI|nr:hypothetical protein [Austropuccinia psidii MF-1]